MMMSKAPENTFFSGTERLPVRWITLPDELTTWADKNRDLIERVQNALSDTYHTLSEEQLWEVVAEASSAEWREAKKDLQTAECQRQELTSPEKTPLGLIGNALDSDKTNAAQEAVFLSLAHFTVINEGLRERQDLAKLLDVLLVQKRMLENSAACTQYVQETEVDFVQKQSFAGLKKSFQRYSGTLFGLKKESAAVHAAPDIKSGAEAAPRPALALSLPKT